MAFARFEDESLLAEYPIQHDIVDVLRNADASPTVHFAKFSDDATRDTFIEYATARGAECTPIDPAELDAQLPGNLYVRGLAPTTQSDDLFRIFKPYGEIQSCKVIFDDLGFSKGYGFINFANKAEANDAIAHLNGTTVGGNALFINHHVSKRDRLKELELRKQNYCNLYLKNVPPKLPKTELEQMFGKFGPIDSVFLPRNDADASLNKGYGFINYQNHESAIAAQKALNGLEVRPGFRLQIGRAERKKDRFQYQALQQYKDDPMAIAAESAPSLPGSPAAAAAVAAAAAAAAAAAGAVPAAPASMVPPFVMAPDSNLISTATGLPIAGPEYQDSNLYITHLPLEFTDEDLEKLFASFGPIISAKVITYQQQQQQQQQNKNQQSQQQGNASLVGKSKGFGFVCFQKPIYASRALVAMNGYRIDPSHILNISFAQRKENKFERGRLHHYNQNSLGNVYRYLHYPPPPAQYAYVPGTPPTTGVALAPMYYPVYDENKENSDQVREGEMGLVTPPAMSPPQNVAAAVAAARGQGGAHPPPGMVYPYYYYPYYETGPQDDE